MTGPPPPLPVPEIPDCVVFHKNPEEDDVGFKATVEAITSPNVFMFFRGALRTTAFVSLPMFVIAIHPNTMYRLGFPQMLIAAVIGTSTHRNTLGEQIGVHSWCLRGITFMLIIGLVWDMMNLNQHEGMWWGLLALIIFGAGLCTNGAIRRFLYLYFFVYAMQLRMYYAYFGIIPETNAAWLAADLYIGTCIGIVANLFPYPILIKSLVDIIMGKLYDGLGKLSFAMLRFAASPDPTGAFIFFSDRYPFEKIEMTLALMPVLLWFSSCEPLEYAVRNPIRRMKLALMKRMMALLYSAFSAGNSIARLRRDLHVRQQVLVERRQLLQEFLAESGAGSDDKVEMQATVEENDEVLGKMSREIKALRENTQRCAAGFGDALMQSMTVLGEGKNNTPAALVESLPLDNLRDCTTALRRNMRVETLQMLKRQGELVAEHREKQKQKGNRGNETASPSSSSSSPSAPKTHEPFEELSVVEKKTPRADTTKDDTVPGGRVTFREPDSADDDERSAVAKLFRQQVQGKHKERPEKPKETETPYGLTMESISDILSFEHATHDIEMFILINEWHFYMILCVLAGEIIGFGESMKDYAPSRGVCSRLWQEIVVDNWNGFWSELYEFIRMARPSDVRTLKDAIKMTCAYMSATALNLKVWVVRGGAYYFGTTILLGLPVEEETLGIGVNRLAGNALGCSLGYLSLHNVKNLSEAIGMTLSFVFVLQLCKHHPIFGQCFFYASFITMAGMATSTITMELLTRVLASCYTIMAYMLACMLIFPNNPVKILWGYRVKFSKVMSETIDDVALTARLPLAYTRTEVEVEESSATSGASGNLRTEEMVVYAPSEDALEMCSQLNIEVSLLKKVQAMSEKWFPFAIKDLILRGASPFPLGPAAAVLFFHTRMLANVEVLVFAVQLLHRPRTCPPHPLVVRLLNGKVADFLEKFAGGCRLFFQDFVNSLHLSRTWSYPVALSHLSYLLRLRIPLNMILFECFALLGTVVSKGTTALEEADFEDMLREEKERQLRRDAAAEGRAPDTVRSGDDDDGGGDDQYAGTGHGGRSNNVSFADRFLSTRRTALAQESGAEDENPSFFLGSSGVNNSITLRNLTMQLNHTSHASNHNSSFARHFAYVAPLETDENRAPDNLYGVTAGNAEQEVAEDLQRQLHDDDREEEGQPTLHRNASRLVSRNVSFALPDRNSGTHTSHRNTREPTPSNRDAGGTVNAEYQPVLPDKEHKRPSKLILDPSRGAEARLPRYQGPLFSYQEDDLDLPIDTDFQLLLMALTSCSTMMGEAERILPAVNNISAYQKQLHETTLILNLIDKVSAGIKKWRSGVHERYHFPEAAESRRALPSAAGKPKGPSNVQMQNDQWEQWRF